MARADVSLIVLLVGLCLLLDRGVSAACDTIEQTCWHRVANASINSPPEENQHVTACRVHSIALSCVEEYICMCVAITDSHRQNFTEEYQTYLALCDGVPGHDLRAESELKCTANQTNGPSGGSPDDPALKLETDDFLDRTKLLELDARLLLECGPYQHCSQVYFQAITLTSFLPHQDQLNHVCKSNRFNLECMSDAFCSCNEADNAIIIKVMNSLKKDHAATCMDVINEPILDCSASNTDRSTENPLETFETKYQHDIAELKELNGDLQKVCLPLFHCSQVYAAAIPLTSGLPSTERVSSTCQISQLNIKCMSDAFCACGLADNATVVKVMNNVKRDYASFCTDVINEPLLNCSANKPPNYSTENPLDNFEKELDVDTAEFTKLNARLLKECDAYLHCSKVYAEADAAAHFLPQHQQLPHLCQANRFNLVCMSDAFCACNEADNAMIVKIMNHLRRTHDYTCNDGMNVTLLDCSANKPPNYSTENPLDNFEKELDVDTAELKKLNARLLNECDAYLHCSKVHAQAYAAAHYLPQHQQLPHLCQANRFNLVCMSDAFCACNEADNVMIVKVMNDLRRTHDYTCNDGMNVALLDCSGAMTLVPSAARLWAATIFTFVLLLLFVE